MNFCNALLATKNNTYYQEQFQITQFSRQKFSSYAICQPGGLLQTGWIRTEKKRKQGLYGDGTFHFRHSFETGF